MARVLDGIRVMEGERDDEGHRSWSVTARVEVNTGRAISVNTNAATEYAVTALLAADAAMPYGSSFQIDADTDLWAWRRWKSSVRPFQPKEGRVVQYYDVTFTYSTKPPDTKRCQDTQIEDPLLVPDRRSGGSKQDKVQPTHDRFGKALRTSSFEGLSGPQVEFDSSKGCVHIEQNRAALELGLCEAMRDCLNDQPIWGRNRRCVKVGDFNWEQKWYGTCYFYFVRKFRFDLDEGGFDRTVLDEGTKALSGHWDPDNTHAATWVLDNIGGLPPDKTNPRHFVRFVDRNGNTLKCVLDGNGKPAGAPAEGTVLLNTVNLINDQANWPRTVFPAPTAPALVRFKVTDPGFTLDNGTVRIDGLDDKGDYAYAEFPFMRAGTRDYDTSIQFTSLLQVNVTNLSGTSAGATLKIVALDTETGPGKINVQHYSEANLLLLGIPIDLEGP